MTSLPLVRIEGMSEPSVDAGDQDVILIHSLPSRPSLSLMASLGAQRTFNELERPGGGGETPSFRTAVLEHGVDHMGWDQLAKLGPGGPVTLTGSLDCPVEHVAGDVRQSDGMPPYCGYWRYSGRRSSSHAAALASQSLLPGGLTAVGQPDGASGASRSTIWR